MERLRRMLTEYNLQIPNSLRYSWSKQYLEEKFPSYWYVVFSQLSKLDRRLHVLEVGCGQGDITSIACYLGFDKITAYERNKRDAEIANNKIETLFGKSNVVLPNGFPDGYVNSDVLIIVNCVYHDDATTKEEYIKKLKCFYEMAGCPKYVLIEVIDSHYDKDDKNFPKYVRLNEEEVNSMFPLAIVNSVETYRYPINKRTKRLYIIENEDSRNH